jgi:diacylglycerol kinase family enzyme
VTLGGDGTAQIALSALVSTGVQNQAVILRLPLGTGNDGLDMKNLGDFLHAADPVLVFRSQLWLTLQQGDRRVHSFNILSFGMDARVSQIANTLKPWLPAWGYDVAVDLAALVNSLLPSPKHLKVLAEQNIQISKPLLCAMGVSGKRSYGKGKRVLPNERNLCLVPRLSLLEILKLKTLFFRGEHGAVPGVEFFQSQDIRVSFQGKLWFQSDGEPFYLEGKNGEVRISLSQEKLTSIGQQV